MQEIDKLRNYFLDYFKTDIEKDEFHLKHWIPIELAQENNEFLEVDFKNFFVSVGGQVDTQNKFFENFVEWINS